MVDAWRNRFGRISRNGLMSIVRGAFAAIAKQYLEPPSRKSSGGVRGTQILSAIKVYGWALRWPIAEEGGNRSLSRSERGAVNRILVAGGL